MRSASWPAPEVSDEVAHDRGPVLITIEYQVRPDDAAHFVATLDELSQARLRDGAFHGDCSKTRPGPDAMSNASR